MDLWGLFVHSSLHSPVVKNCFFYQNCDAWHGFQSPLLKKLHSYDILGVRMLWKPKEARILKNFIDQPV